MKNEYTLYYTLQRHADSALTGTEIARSDRRIGIHSFRHTYNSLVRPLLPREVLQSSPNHKIINLIYDYTDLDKNFALISKYISRSSDIFSTLNVNLRYFHY